MMIIIIIADKTKIRRDIRRSNFAKLSSRKELINKNLMSSRCVVLYGSEH